jgi:hypothetical protein
MGAMVKSKHGGGPLADFVPVDGGTGLFTNRSLHLLSSASMEDH